jgi:ankyrin repeat protein
MASDIIQPAENGNVDDVCATIAAMHVNQEDSPDLFDAAVNGNLARVQESIAAGVDINHANYVNKHTALMLASHFCQTAVVRALLAAGANVDLVDEWGLTALTRATKQGHTAVVTILKDAKGIRIRHLLKKWREATHARCIANYWWRIAGEGQHAEGMPGRKRDLEDYEAEYEAE